MSRSRRKTKVFGNKKDRHGSDKIGKKMCSRILRSRIKQKLKTCQDWESFIPPMPNEAYNIYNFPADGYHYWKDATDKDMLK